MARLKRHKGKVVGHIIAYDSPRSHFGWRSPRSGEYYQTNPPKTAKWAMVNVYKENTKRTWERAGKPKVMKISTVRKLHLV